MKKSIKRWLALLLAIAMIATSGAFTNLTYLRATDGEETVEAQAEEPKAETQEKEKEKTEKVTVEQAEPEQPAPEAKEEKKEETAPQEEAPEEETKEEPSNKEEAPSAEEKEEPAKEEQETVSEEKTEESAPAASEKTADVETQGEKTEEAVDELTEDDTDVIKADPIEETDDETEEVKYPAVTFEEKASNGVSVKVEAPEGAFPEGTTIKVKAVSDEKAMSIYEQTLPEDQRAVEAKGVDITFYNAEGEEIQPKKEIKVSLKCDALEGKNFSVVHEKDNGDVEVMTENAAATGATFGATSFSTYTIGSSDPIYEGTQDDATVEEENAVVVTVKVQTEDGTPIKQDSKTVYKAENEETFSFSYSLDALEDGYYYSLASGTDEAFSLAGTTLTASFDAAGTATVTVIHVAQEVEYTITTREESLENPDEMTEVSSTTEKGKVGEMTEVIPVEKEGFSASVDQKVIAASGTVVYVDYTRNTYFLTYNTNGGSYVPSKSGVYGATVDVYSSTVTTCTLVEHTHSSVPTSKAKYNKGKTIGCYTSKYDGDKWRWELTCGKEEHTHSSACQYATYDPAPTRQGYTFGGWYADTDCTQVADKTATLTGNVTVYAKWIPGTADYRVVYQKQNLDGTYSYVSSETKSGTVGTTVSGSNYSKTFTDSSYYHKASSTSAAVKADGSTVVYVKYDLNTYYLVFDLNTNNSNITLTKDGNSYTKDTSPKYTITCKFGEDISAKWPTKDDISGTSSDTLFYGWKRENSNSIYVSKRFEVTADMLNNTSNGSSTSYTASWKSGSSVYLHYMLQNTDDNGYTDSEKYSQAAIRGTGDGDYTAKNIAGYTYISGTPDGYQSTYTDSTTGVKHYYFYYDRKTYDIDYYFGSEKLTTKSNIRFGKNINNDTYNYTPDKPSAVDPEATFGGWYDNPDCTGDPYTFSTMPANNLALYANWVVPDKTVTVVYHNGDKDGSIKVPKGSYIEDLPNPTRDGYEFAGWFDADGNAFDINAPIMQDVTIYAHWTEKTTVSYIVRYVCDGTEISSETKYGKVGSTVSAKAALPAGYDASEYVVAPARANLTLTRAESENVITFTVTKLSDLKYTVEYKYNGNFVLEGSTPVTDAAEYTASSTTMRVYPNSGIVQKLNKLGYKLNETYITLNYTGEQKTLVATFTLSPKSYTITYTGMEGASWKSDANHPDSYTTVDQPIQISNPVKTGYEFTGWEIDGTNTKNISGTHNGMAVVIGTGSVGNLTFNATWKVKQYPYTVKYYLNNTTTELKEQDNGPATDYGTTIPVSAAVIEGYHLADGQTAPRMLTIGTGKNEVIFYYSPNTYSYKVNYLSKVDGSTVKPAKVDTALFGEKVTETAETADGYTLAGASSQTIDITTGTNVINFYYYKNTTLTANSDEKEYNGTTQSVSGYYVTETSAEVVLEGISAGASGVDAGEYTAVFAGDPTGKVIDDKYYVTGTVNGLLTITAKSTPIIIRAASGSKTYDGTALVKNEYTYTQGILVDGDVLTAEVSGSQTNAGSSDNVVTSYKVMRGTTDVTANYTFGASEKGTLTVNKREVTLTSGSAEKVYNGTALTKDEVKVTEGSFVTGEGATYTVTGSQIDVGTSDNVFEYTLNDGTSADNYYITTVYGKLTVKKSEETIIITAPSGSKKYDGTALEVSTGATYTGTIAETDTLLVTLSGSQTDAGSSENNVASYRVVRGEKDVTANYTFGESVPGTLTVTPRTVTLTSATQSKTYDGTALTNGTVTVSGDGFISGEGVTYDVTGSQLDAGTSKNTFTYTLNGNTKAGNYTINKVEGDLTVNPITTKIVITADSERKMYDGSPLTDDGYTYTPDVLVSGDVLTAVVSGSRTDAGSSANVVSSYKVMRGEKDVTANYTFDTSVDGTLTVTKRNVTLTSATASKTYDGTALTNDTVTVGGNGFVTGEGATYDVTGSQLDAGTSKNTFTYTLNSNTKADNYEITKVEGDLTVTAITTPIVITANSNSKTYDGAALTDSGYTYTPNVLVTGDRLTAVVEGSQKDAGVSDNVVTSYKVMRGETDVTANYTFGASEKGTLTVNKREVTLTSGSASKVYDGQPLTNNEVTVTSGSFVDGEGATYTVTGSQINFGSSKNKFTYTLNDNTNADNYIITTVEGDLTVRKSDKTIIITANSKNKTYDGTPLTDSGYTYTQGVLVQGDELTAVVEGSQTDVGTGDNVVTSYQVMRGTEDVTGNYEFGDCVDGTLTVTKRNVTLTSATDSKTYDGTALTNHKVTVTGDGFADGEGATYNVTGSQLDAGGSPNRFTYELNSNTNAANYAITTNTGTLTVNPITTKIVITADSDSKTYDGIALTDSGYTYTEGVVVSGDVLTAVVSGSQTDAGSSANVVSSYKVMRGEKDVTANYTFDTSVDGTLTVTKRNVTLTSATASKTYDGTALTNGTVTVGGDGFVTGEGASYTVTGSQLDAGTSDNTFTYTLNSNTKADNYEITKVEGDLTVTAITTPIVITANSNSKTYDGAALTDSGYTYTPNVLVTGDRLTAVVEGSQKDAGVSDNVVTSYKVMRGETDVTANYTFGTSEKGTLRVNKREVTLTSGSAEKVYNGTALTKDEVKVTAGSFVTGEGATYTVTGSQIDVGTSDNVFEYTLNDGTSADNYNITKVYGKLTVKKSEETIIITAPSGSKKYDGTALEVSTGATYTGTIAETDTLLVTLSGSQTDAGSSENKVASYRVVRGEKDVTANYTFGESVPGTLTVTPRTVTLTSATQSKTYDGTALTNGTVTVSGDGFISGEGVTYDVTGSQLDAGTSKNTFTYTLNGNTKAGNYTINKVEGDLTVNPITTKIVITADSDSKMYDGSPLTDDGYTYTPDVLVSGDVLTAVVSGSRTDAGTAANVVTSYKVKRGETDVTSNYSFDTSVNGTLTITKRNVTLTSATASKTYDGTALTNDTVTVGGNGFVTGEGATYTVTGSQLDAGSSKNAFTYALNEGTNAANYDITTVEGTLTVNKITTPIVITAGSDSKVYDGESLTKLSVTYTPNVLIEGDVLKPVVSGSQTDVGSSANVVTSYSVMRGDVDVTKNYTFGDCVDGTLTVTKRQVTLTSGSANKAYDGKPLTNSTVTEGGQGFVAGQGATYTVTGSRIDIGTSDNTFTYSLNEGTNAANYDITSIEGKLTVTQKTDTIIITAPSDSKVYDGQSLTLSDGATYEGTLAEGDRLKVVLGGSQTDVGTSACTVASYQIVRGEGEDEKDVTSYYTGIQTVNGNLTVTPRPVTLTSATDSKTYDGTVLTNSTVTVGGDGFAASEGATFTVTGSQLDKGTSNNTFTYQLNEGTKAGNYTITTFEGTLTVVPIGGEGKTITITADSNTKVYDGIPLTDNGFTYTENILVAGDILTANVEGTLTNVGTAANKVTSYQVMRGTTDVTGNYTFNTSVDGTLEVTKRPVTLTSGSAEKVFDTTALTNAEITVGGEGFVKDEGATYNVTGSQTLVGFSENEFEYTLKTGTAAENYEITKEYGILTVTDGSVTEPVDPSKVISKTHSDKTDNTRYNLGETVTFTITVMNIYAEPKTITLTEQGGVTLTKSVFENVQPGVTVSTTASYVITEADILKGEYNNTVKASFSGGQSYEATDTVDPEDNKPNLKVNKTVVGKTEGYKLGEKITYKISVTNNGNVTIKDIKVTDSLTGDVLSFDDVAPGAETDSQTVEYTVTEADIVAGKVANVATVTSGQDDKGEEPDATPGEATVDTEDVNAHLKVNKTEASQAPAGGYKLGDVITYKISVTNDGNVTIKGVKVYDDLTGQTLDFGDIAANPEGNVTTAEQEVTYTVKEEDILRGYVKNNATIAAGEDPNGETPSSNPGTVTVETDEVHAKLVVNKKTTSTAPDNGYGVGDTITYEISVTNKGNVTIKGVVVTDILTGETHNFGDIAPNKEGNATTDVWTVSYTVTEADVSKGQVVNEAVVTAGKDPNGNDPEKESGKTTDTTEEKNSHLTITKTTTSTMPEGGYKLGDKITYSIEVVNDGNQTLNNVVVNDTITGDTWNIGTMSIGAKETYTASYTVTEADIRNGKVVNEAIMTSGTDPDGEDPTVDPGETEDPTVPKNSHLTLTKTVLSEPAEGDAYALGETIIYAIVATNDGNQTLTNVNVVDELTGDAWTIESIAPGQSSEAMETSYTVKEEDILNGSVKNVATVAEATDPEGEEPEVTPGEEEVPTEQQKPSLFIKKVADKRSNLQEGDVITYTITVVNNGNVTIDNIVVNDELTGDTFDKNAFNLIGTISLKPGESRDFTVRYTVTQADLINGTIKNVANVTGTDPNGDTIDESAEETVETEKANAAYTVDKAIVDPKPEYNVGDTINYTIKVTNTGNLTLNNLVVTDQMQGTAGTAVISDQAGVTVDGNKATIAVLRPGASITLNAAYTVTREDADGTISNKVTVNSGSKPGTDPEDPKAPGTPEGGDETDPKPIEKTYLLTIRYVDNDGNVVAPDYTVRLLAGETIDAVASPAVDGYTPDYGTVALPATGMPAQDVTVTVVYTANVAVLPVNPGQPNDDNDNGGGQVVNNNDNAPAPVADDAPAPEPQAPADGVIEPTDDGGYDLTPVEEPQTPLGNMDLDDHTCCILHFLIMLLTLIIFALYTKSRKNRQMKVADLKEQLAIATIQKELGLSDEEMARYLEEAKTLANADKQANA